MAVCGWKFSGVASVHSQECQMLRTSCKEKPNQWSEHFTSLLKFLSSIFNEALNEVSDLPSQEQQATKQHKLFWLSCEYCREGQQALAVLLVREHHLAWPRHNSLQTSRTSRWFLRSSSMQRFNSTKRVELMPWKMVHSFTSCREKETSAFAGIMVSRMKV